MMLEECPGGVCPVPWAVDTSGEDSSAKSEQSSSWDTYINKHEEVLKEINKDNVNHPAHYTDGGIECIEAIEAQLTPEEYRGYLKGNVAKYVWREQHKGGIESLKKAQWYLLRLVLILNTTKKLLTCCQTCQVKIVINLFVNIVRAQVE